MLRSLVVGLVLLTAACGGSVQVLEHTRTAGTINVGGSDEAVRSRADEYIRAHCRGSYTLVDERPVNDGWRMAYRCEPKADGTVSL